MKTDFALCAPLFSETGYGNHSRAIYKALKKQGWKINLFTMENPEYYDNNHKKEMMGELISDPKELRGQPCIHIQPPPNTRIKSKYDIIYTTLESKTVHWGAMNRIELFDEVWTPCWYNWRAIEKAKKKKMPNWVMPEGVETDVYKPGDPHGLRYKYHDYFIVLYIGDWSQRKGIEKLIKAFWTAELDRPGLLVLKTNYQGDRDAASRAVMWTDFYKWTGEVRQVGTKAVKMIHDFVTQEELVKLYNAADLYAILTMGEAWSLTVTQAFACKVPVMTTRASGHMDFCSGKTAALVKVKRWGVMDDESHVDVDFYRGQLFAHPDQEHAKKMIEKVCRKPGVFRKKAERGYKKITQEYTWENSAKTIGKRMEVVLRKIGNY